MRPVKRPDRPLREDLVMQAALEAYSLFRRERWLADRALEHTLRPKRNLYANERRAVSERVYAAVRRQRAIDHLLAALRPGLDALPTSRQDLLRLHAARVLEGESPAAVVRSAAFDPPDARALERLPEAAAGDSPSSTRAACRRRRSCRLAGSASKPGRSSASRWSTVRWRRTVA